jgi:hypothetical protein
VQNLLQILDEQIANAWSKVTVLQNAYDAEPLHQWWLGHARAWEQAKQLVQEQNFLERS